MAVYEALMNVMLFSILSTSIQFMKISIPNM